MKWTIQELIKRVNTDNTFDFVVDFSDQLDNTDILGISDVSVSGDFEIYDNTEFVFYMDIECTLTLACAITLDEVEYKMDFSTEETFSTVKNDDFNYIEGITIDLLPIIWSNIILEKPMRVISENATNDFEKDNVEIDTENSNNAFAKLKDFKN
jgi:uncharacterized protein